MDTNLADLIAEAERMAEMLDVRLRRMERRAGLPPIEKAESANFKHAEI